MSRIKFGVWVAMALILVPQVFSQKILTTIQIGGFTGTPAVNTATNMIYVPNTTTGAVVVIDGKTNRIVTTIPVGVAPYAIAAANPATNLIYVAAGDAEQQIAVIDGSSCIQTMAYSPFTNRIYGTMLDDSLAIIDADNFSFITVQFPPLAIDVYGVATDNTSNRVYVGTDNVGLYVIDGINGEILSTIQPDHFAPIAVNQTNHLIADIGFSDQTVSIFLGFANGHNYAPVGNQVAMPKNQTPYGITPGVNNRYYVTFYQHDGVMVVSGP